MNVPFLVVLDATPTLCVPTLKDPTSAAVYEVMKAMAETVQVKFHLYLGTFFFVLKLWQSYHTSASKTANSRSLADVDECSSPEGNSCDTNAMCTNTEGSYVCRCLRGFTGDGLSCSGKVRQSLTIIK